MKTKACQEGAEILDGTIGCHFSPRDTKYVTIWGDGCELLESAVAVKSLKALIAFIEKRMALDIE